MGILSRLFGGGNQRSQGNKDEAVAYCGGCQKYLSYEEFTGHDCLPDYDYTRPVCYRCGSHNINHDKGKCLDCGGKRLMQS